MANWSGVDAEPSLSLLGKSGNGRRKSSKLASRASFFICERGNRGHMGGAGSMVKEPILKVSLGDWKADSDLRHIMVVLVWLLLEEVETGLAKRTTSQNYETLRGFGVLEM